MYVLRNLFMANKKKCITVAASAFTILFFMLFLYAIPGYLVKKILGA